MKRWLSARSATRSVGLLSLFGIALGVALVVFSSPLSSTLTQAVGYNVRVVVPPARPSPTWAPMPTRARSHPTITVNENHALRDLRLVLLRRDLEAARLLWEQSPPPQPPDQAAWYRNGARLFMASGQVEQAQTLVLSAIVLAPKEMGSWSLLHLISREMGDWRMADYALEIALALEPSRADDLFWDRWLLAVRDEDVNRMAALAESFAIRNPDDPLQTYFSAKVLLVTGEGFEAATRLIDALERDPGAPIVLWYALGEAYLELGAYQEARSVLETAAERVYEGDRTATHLEAPFFDNLNFNLARAYLGSGACANAEAVFRRLAASETTQGAPDTTQGAPEATRGAPDNARGGSETTQRGASRFDAWIQQAVRCQTPTPTLTPWILSQQSTPTPTPPQN